MSDTFLKIYFSNFRINKQWEEKNHHEDPLKDKIGNADHTYSYFFKS